MGSKFVTALVVRALVFFLGLDQAQAQIDLFDYSEQVFGSQSTLGLWVVSLDSATGQVQVNGADSQGPSTPFTWIWGDGNSNSGWFPQNHTYIDPTQNYVLTVIAHYNGGLKDTVAISVRFIPSQFEPDGLLEEYSVTIPTVLPILGTRLYTSPSLQVFDDSFFVTTPRLAMEDILTVATTVEMDFTNHDTYLFEGGFRQEILWAQGFPGGYSIWYSDPIAFGAGEAIMGATPGYYIFFHEIGHNLTLNSPAAFYYGGRLDGNANAIFSESVARMYQQATGYVMYNQRRLHGIPEDMATEIKISCIAGMNGLRNEYENYIDAGMPFASYNNPGTPEDEVFTTFHVIAFVYCQHAETKGWGYRAPLKRLWHLMQVFDADIQAAWDPSVDSPAADSVRATMMATAVGYAFDEDLRSEFAALDFPIKDSVYTSLLAKAGTVNTVPVLLALLEDTSLTVVGGGYTFDIAILPYFMDPDGDPLTYSALSNDPLIADATMTGSEFTVTPISDGTAAIVITADDGNGGTEQTAFWVTIDGDSDDDGIADDGDLSGTIGDNPCTGGATADCDDNCLLIANADQADTDGDGIGDACCCLAGMGDIRLVGNCADDNTVDVADLTDMIDHLFINFTPICCPSEGDIAPLIDGDPANGVVDVADLTVMIDHLFINFPTLPVCP